MAKYCANCGEELKEGAAYCAKCGTKAGAKTTKKTVEGEVVKETTNTSAQPKSKIAAGLLGIFLGSFGVHNFYLGYNGKAVAQLLLTLIGWLLCFTGPFIAGIWGLIEGILILTGSINTDAEGNQLVD